MNLRSCERPPCPWTLSTFRGGPLEEIVLRVFTSGIVTSGSSHQLSCHYRSGSIEESPVIIPSYLSHLGAKDRKSCERSPYPQTLSTFRGGPLEEIDLRVFTSGIVTSGSSHHLSYHYHFGSIEESPVIIPSYLSHLGAMKLRSCERPSYPWTLPTF